MSRSRVTREAAIEALRAFGDREGRRPTWDEWRARRCRPSTDTIAKLFGSWQDGLVAAGFERVGQGGYERPFIDRDAECIVGPCENRQERSDGRCRRCDCYLRRTGREWDPARLRQRPPVYAPEAVVEAIRRWVAEHGEVPSLTEWRAAGVRPGVHTVYRRFGSWCAAVEAAGFTPMRSGGGAARRGRT